MREICQSQPENSAMNFEETTHAQNDIFPTGKRGLLPH